MFGKFKLNTPWSFHLGDLEVLPNAQMIHLIILFEKTVLTDQLLILF